MEISIGELSGATGVKVPTIRYYEEIGLLPSPVRTSGNQRRYSPDHKKRLSFIRHARELGFSVDSIRRLLQLSDEPAAPCDEVDQLACERLAEVEHRLQKLNALKKELKRMIAQCAGGSVSECRIIEVLADHTHCKADH